MSHLTFEERQAYTAAFLRVDADGNGALDIEEFSQMCKALSVSSYHGVIKKMFQQIDTDGNGKITLDEFLAAMPGKTKTGETKEEASLRKSFNDYDANGDGFLDAEEIRQVLRANGRRVTLEHAQKMIRRIDKDGDGKVCLDEFLAYHKLKQTSS